MNRISLTTLFFILLTAGVQIGLSQSADNRGSILPGNQDEDDQRPKSFRETLQKMRIDKEKKEYAEMIERGEEALKISTELETSFQKNGSLQPNEISKLNEVEKLVKKIRSELGGDDDDDKKTSPVESTRKSDLISSFRSSAEKLLDELKKTSRFTVSAAAITASNTVLRLTRLLKGGK